MEWSDLKSLVNSSFARNIILIPVVGWLVIYNDEFIRSLYSALGAEDVENIELSWQTLVFYLGLILVGMASAWFQFSCPTEIKAHVGLRGFIQDTNEFGTAKTLESLRHKTDVSAPSYLVPDTSASDGADVARHQWLRMNEGAINDTLAGIYAFRNVSKPFQRFGVLICFIAGAAITLVPTVFTIYWAISELTSRWA